MIIHHLYSDKATIGYFTNKTELRKAIRAYHEELGIYNLSEAMTAFDSEVNDVNYWIEHGGVDPYFPNQIIR